MATRPWIKPLFQIAALYDFGLGALFLGAFRQIFARLQLVLPNHAGYVQFPALLIMTFGIGFWWVAQAPERNRTIIHLGILLKLSYVGVVLGHWLFGTIPWIWVPFAWCDLVFLGCFAAALRAIPVTS